MSDRSDTQADDRTIFVGMPYQVVLDIENALADVAFERNTDDGQATASAVDALTDAVGRFLQAARSDGELELRAATPDDGARGWKVSEVWTTSTGDVHTCVRGYFGQEPRSGDLMFQVLQPAAERLNEARAQETAVMFCDGTGAPVALQPSQVTSVQVRLTAPNGVVIGRMAPGHVHVDGPVERDAEGDLL